MKMSRRILTVLIAVAMTVSLAACGTDSDTVSDGASKAEKPNSGETASKKDNQKMPSNLKGSTIKYFMWYDGTKETEGPIIKSFELESDVKVDIEVGSSSNFTTELAAKVATGASPDVIRMVGPGIAYFKLLQPLANTGYDFSGSEWDQQTMKDYSVNGKAYATNLKKSIYFDSSVLWYNYQTLSDLGVDDPYTLWKQGKWTWDSLWSDCREFVKQGGNYGACFSPVNAVSLAYGVDFIDWDGTKYINSVADPDRNAKLVTAWTECIKKKQEKLITPDTWLIADFDAGRSAFFGTSISSGFAKRSYFEQFKSNGELRCVPYPASYTGDNMIVLSEYSAWGVPKGAKNKEAVPYFLKYMLDESNYDLDDAFSDASIADVFKTLRDSDKPRYKRVLDSTLLEADSGLNRFQMFDKLYSGEIGQISSTLQSFRGGIQNSVDKANAQLKSLE